jgi:hypothetical protein
VGYIPDTPGKRPLRAYEHGHRSTMERRRFPITTESFVPTSAKTALQIVDETTVKRKRDPRDKYDLQGGDEEADVFTRDPFRHRRVIDEGGERVETRGPGRREGDGRPGTQVSDPSDQRLYGWSLTLNYTGRNVWTGSLVSHQHKRGSQDWRPRDGGEEGARSKG